MVNRLIPEHTGNYVIHNNGMAFSGDLRSFIDRQVYLFGGYEAAQIRSFVAQIPEGRRRTILDIGANAGTHSLAFARAFEVVHAFEPNSILWPQFERNVVLNQVENVFLHRIGLADRDAQLTLHMIDKPNLGLGTFSSVEQYDLPLRAVATCTVRHAGDYLAQIGAKTIDAVKIDVQGFEPEVLRGLREVLRRDRPFIWCEIGAGTLTKTGTVNELSKLFPFGVRCLRFDIKSKWLGEQVELSQCRGVIPAGDYLIVPVA